MAGDQQPWWHEHYCPVCDMNWSHDARECDWKPVVHFVLGKKRTTFIHKVCPHCE